MKNLDRITKIKMLVADYASGEEFSLCPLNTDASSRKYYRVNFANRQSLIVLDDEKLCCKTPEFVRLSVFLRAGGVYVPKVYYQDLNNGLLIIEDLGDQTIRNLLTTEDEQKLYLMSADAIAKVVNITQRPDGVSDLSPAKIVEDLHLFSEWYYPMTVGQPLTTSAKQDFFDIINRLLPMAYKVPNRLVLWDYHIDNIMLPPQSSECAIIDFQDAMWGPLTYDIMSLVAADRRLISPALISTVKEHFFAGLNGINRQDFEDSFAFLSAFRHLRVLGRFTTLSMVNRKEKYLDYIPQVWQMLEQMLEYPALAELKQWLDCHIPPQQRGLPRRKPINSAIILAAGRGQRMRNLTDDLPKPLIKVGDKALIDYNFERLQAIHIDNIVVNLCYKGELIRNHLTTTYPDSKITFSEESEALETGGGVLHALPLLEGEAFFVCNSDVFFIDDNYKPILWQMLDEWNEQKCDILLMLQDVTHICGDSSGDYLITPDGHLERNCLKQSGYPYMFGGISLVSRKIFAGLNEHKFSLRDLFDQAQSLDRLGFVINKSTFFHVGTPEALSSANTKLTGINKKSY